MWWAQNVIWPRRWYRIPSSPTYTCQVSARFVRRTCTRSRCCNDSNSSSTVSVWVNGDCTYDSASASVNSAALAKWWKNDPVVTPAASATFAVVAPANTFRSGSSSKVRRPARTSRSRVGSSVWSAAVIAIT